MEDVYQILEYEGLSFSNKQIMDELEKAYDKINFRDFYIISAFDTNKVITFFEYAVHRLIGVEDINDYQNIKDLD